MSLKNKLEEKFATLPETVWSTGFTETPALPYRGKGMQIPQNLISGTQYTLSTSPTIGQFGTKISGLIGVLNNLVEIVIYSMTEGVSTTLSAAENNSEILKHELENHLKKIVEQLETGRLSLKAELENIQGLATSQYETLYAHQQTIAHLIAELHSKSRYEETASSLKEILEISKKSKDKEILASQKLIQESLNEVLSEVQNCKKLTDSTSSEILKKITEVFEG